MFEIPVEDFVFVVCTLVGGGLLLITVLLDDLIGGLFDSFEVDIGGASLMPLLLSFVAMFGVGGLFATQVLDVHGAGAAGVGFLSGLIGAGLAFGLFRFLRESTSPSPFSPRDLVGEDAHVSVAIPASGWGTVYLAADGQTHELRATSTNDLSSGQTVRIRGVAGAGLVVEPAVRPWPDQSQPDASDELGGGPPGLPRDPKREV